jgi:hypothetical protein
MTRHEFHWLLFKDYLMKRLLAAALLIATISLLHESAGAAEPAKKQLFKLDGNPFEPEIYSLRGTPEQPRPGDVINVNDIFLTLGPEEVQEFFTTPEAEGKLMLATSQGRQVVGLRIGKRFGRGKPVPNPLDQLTAKEIAGLRGIRINQWSEQVAGKLKAIDMTRACLTLTDETAQGADKSLPALPAGLQYLCIQESSNQGIRDYGSLKDSKNLKLLKLSIMTAAIDLALISRNEGMLLLDLRGAAVKNVAALASLKQLRQLDLGYARAPDTIAFASSMDHLVRLDVSSTKVSDLSPVGRIDNLVSLKANQTPVEKLPDGKLPGLKTLQVMSTDLTDKAVADFASKHPACAVAFRWDAALRAAAKDADRVRVRTGGTCHRNINAEKTLFEEKEAKQIAAMLQNIRINERQSGFHCMCCGFPSIEFYKGDELLLTLGFHHGRSLRWPGMWPGDCLLEPASADRLCDWLAAHGYKDAREQRNRTKKEEAAAARLQAKYEALIPERVIKRLKKAESAEQAAKAFTDEVEAGARAELYLRLYGCSSGAWNHSTGLDDFVKEKLLPGIAEKDLMAAIAKVKDSDAFNGAARWLFAESKWKSLDPKAQQQALVVLGKHALADPWPFNRRYTLKAVEEIDGAAATELLRAMVAGKINPREHANEDRTQPASTVVARPGDLDLLKGSDRAFAALALAKRGDKEIFPTIRELAKTAGKDDKELFQKATEIMDKRK